MSKLTSLSKNCDRLHFPFCDRCGLRLLTADIIPSPNVFGIKKNGSGLIRIATALFQGVLEMTAPEPFVSTVNTG